MLGWFFKINIAFFHVQDTTKPPVRCLGDGASENNNTLIDHKSTIELLDIAHKNTIKCKINVLINVEYQRLQKFK